MTAPYRLYGSELSPYSLKVRAFLRFKGLAHEWLPRTLAREQEFARFAKLPLIPVLVGADDFAMQDSTPILEKLEHRYPEPTATPSDPALAFLSAVVEDYADEWLNKAMFHYRWARDVDQASAAARIAQTMLEGVDGVDHTVAAAQIRERMVGRLHVVGSSAETAPVIEASYRRLLALLEAHLANRPYLFGARPAFGDFGLAGQLQQLLSDPTPGALMRESAPAVADYCARMASPAAEGEFETREALLPTLRPILAEEVTRLYLTWAAANAEAARGEAGHFSVALDGQDFPQGAQRYAAKAFLELRRKRAALADDAALASLLEEIGADRHLAPPTRPSREHDEAEESAEADGDPEDAG